MIKQTKLWIVGILIALVAFFIAKPKGKRTIVDWKVVDVILKKAFGKDCTLFLVDNNYKIPTLKSIKTFLAEDKTDLYKYTSEWFDCDDFSFRLMGQFSIPGWSDITFGIATSTVHAYNCLIADDNGEMKVYLIEPQTDAVIAADSPRIQDEVYRTIFVMM